VRLIKYYLIAVFTLKEILCHIDILGYISPLFYINNAQHKPEIFPGDILLRKHTEQGLDGQVAEYNGSVRNMACLLLN
jgi:hypothetical protein